MKLSAAMKKILQMLERPEDTITAFGYCLHPQRYVSVQSVQALIRHKLLQKQGSMVWDVMEFPDGPRTYRVPVYGLSEKGWHIKNTQVMPSPAPARTHEKGLLAS